MAPIAQNYGSTASFNVGIASQLKSIEAALLYDELAFWSNKGIRADGWVYKEYADLQRRFAGLMSIRSLQRYMDKLIETGMIETVVMKVAGTPKLHYRLIYKVGIFHSDKLAETIDSDKLAETIYTATNTATNKQAASPSATEKELLANLNEVTGRTFRTLPNSATKTLKHFTVAEIRQALDALAADPWHAAKLKELSTDYLLRITTIEKFFVDGVNGIVPLDQQFEGKTGTRSAALDKLKDLS